jgi:peroxiredoxin
MELEALQQIDSEVRALGARIVVITPELERYARALHKKLNLSFDILTDLHLKVAEQFSTCFHTTRLFARPLQVLWKHSRQIQR